MRGIFITGTDTNVGKTVAAAAMIHRYRDHASLRYWKPIQTGLDLDTPEVQRLGVFAEEVFDDGIRLPDPVSPHLAAANAGRRIDLEELRALAHEETVNWIVEGAGGILVPINESSMMIDWMKMLGLPVLLVARTVLGTINHTLLSLEALRARQLEIVGVLMIGEPNSANRNAIEKYGNVAVLDEIPVLTPLNAAMLGAWSCSHFDRKARLQAFFK